MDASDLFKAMRVYLRARKQELLESLVKCDDIEKNRGRVLEVDTTYDKLQEIMKTTGDDDDDS